jgi:hypothetical protein
VPHPRLGAAVVDVPEELVESEELDASDFVAFAFLELPPVEEEPEL